MAPQLKPAEIDFVRGLFGKGLTASEALGRLASRRRKSGKPAPDITTIRRVLKARTHRAARQETRGRKAKVGLVKLRRLNSTRKALIKHADGESEVHLEDVMKKARVTDVHRSTVSRAFKRIGVAWRAPREKPSRTAEDRAERQRICGKWKYLAQDYFTDRVDLIMDNKKFDVPTHDRARKYQKMLRVRGHLRAKEEGVKPGFTKPNSRKNKVNPGAKVNVCAAIINCRIKVWHYLPDRWSGAAAVNLYKGPIVKALRKHRGNKPVYHIVEDNDPTGYRSGVAVAAKAELGICPMEYPRYSPDLNPLDFFVWNEVARRMNKEAIDKGLKREPTEAYKIRLRRTAMSLPEDVIRKAVGSMKRRAAAIVDAKGDNITMD